MNMTSILGSIRTGVNNLASFFTLNCFRDCMDGVVDGVVGFEIHHVQQNHHNHLSHDPDHHDIPHDVGKVTGDILKTAGMVATGVATAGPAGAVGAAVLTVPMLFSDCMTLAGDINDYNIAPSGEIINVIEHH